MTRKQYSAAGMVIFAAAIILFGFSVGNAQYQNTYGGGYSTGYGTVYGSAGLAMATQNIYLASQLQMQKTMARNLMIKKFGLPAVEKAEREAAAGSSSGARTKTSASPASGPKLVVPPPRVVRNYGVFRPDPAVDTGQALANALADTPDDKALIKRIYTATKAAYGKEAAARGWKNNIAGGLTFFTVTAMTVYRNGEEPSSGAANAYFKVVNNALDDLPAFATVTNKDKQNFDNMLIGFSGLLLAGYSEGKQNNDASTLATYKKLAGNLITMVLKTDPENLVIRDDQILVK